MPTSDPTEVLVVADDTDMARALASRMRAAGLAVLTAADARNALAQAGGAKLSLIVIDLSPTLDPTRALLARLHDTAPSVPILALGVGRETIEGPKARAQGATAYVSKSSDPSRIDIAVRRLLDAT